MTLLKVWLGDISSSDTFFQCPFALRRKNHSTKYRKNVILNHHHGDIARTVLQQALRVKGEN